MLLLQIEEAVDKWVEERVVKHSDSKYVTLVNASLSAHVSRRKSVARACLAATAIIKLLLEICFVADSQCCVVPVAK